MKKLFTLVFVCIAILQSYGQIIRVPQDYTSIQQAINNAEDKDTIIVDEGTYNENVQLHNKNIVLASRFIETGNRVHIENTIIDGQQNGSVLHIENGVDSTTVIIGFTITNGSGSPWDIDLTGNRIVYIGGGVYIGEQCNPILQYLQIKNNNADYGGGIAIKGGATIIENTQIVNNTSTTLGGGVFYNGNYRGIDITGCLIAGNISQRGGGVDYGWGFDDKRYI